MQRSTQKHLVVSASLVTFTLSAFPAAAQEIEEIVVTARQREEALSDVPASIAVFTEGVIERANIERAEDFIYMTPGVSLVDSAEVGDTQVSIRGINGSRDAEANFAFIVAASCTPTPAPSTASSRT
jgi:iron complex outermembrane receptor protein